MRTINYWITFHDIADKYSEVMAVRVVFELADDHLSGRAEVPFLGIVIEGDGTVLAQALSLAQSEIARRYKGQIRQGLQTQAWNGETRDVRYAETDGVIFGRERCLEEESARGCQLYYALHQVTHEYETAALADADTAAAVGQVAGTQAALEITCGQVETNPAFTKRPMRFDENSTRLGVDGHHLSPVCAAKNTPVKDVANLEAIDGRRVDDDLAAHDADALCGIGGARSSGHRSAPRQLGLFFVDDLPGVNAKRGKEFRANGVGPASKVIGGINHDRFPGLGVRFKPPDFGLRHHL